MKREKLDDVLKKMEDVECSREDINLTLNTLNMRDDGLLTSRTYGEFKPSDTAIKKLCNIYNLNHKHMKTLISEDRVDLVADQLNHFLKNDNRMMKMRTIEGDRIKGFVNTNYRKFDDYDLFHLINDYLVDNELDYNLHILEQNDEHTRIRVTINDIHDSMGAAHEGGVNRDIVQGGIEVTNSEIGSTGIGLNSLVYRQVCSNGMLGFIGDEENKEIFYKRGRDFNPFARRSRLNNGINNALNQSSNSIKLFEKTKHIEIKDPKKEFHKLASRYKLGKSQIDHLLDMYTHEPQGNYFGIINAISRHADRNFKNDYNNRAKFETMANELLSEITK